MRFVPSIKDKQSINLRSEKEEKGTNLSAEYGVSTEQISDIRKNKKGIFLNLSIIHKKIMKIQLKNWLNSSLTRVLILLENT